PAAWAQTPSAAQEPAMAACLPGLVARAREQGVTPALAEARLSGLTADPDVVAATHRQAEFEKPVWAYLDAAVSERDALAAQLAALQAAPAAVLPAVSDRQFFQSLAAAGTISQDEALAAVMTGTLPARIEAAVAGLPAAEQFAARMLLSGATAFERSHPMVAQLGAALGYDAAALDALWRQAAAL
ncbi:hypothetical protein VQ03_09290, partial [Methylobacterium tarhaniae]